jgi:hypothetical protein
MAQKMSLVSSKYKYMARNGRDVLLGLSRNREIIYRVRSKQKENEIISFVDLLILRLCSDHHGILSQLYNHSIAVVYSTGIGSIPRIKHRIDRIESCSS